MITTAVILLFLLAVGVPIGRVFGFAFNPFWAFTNYKRIKNNPDRVSDFYNSAKIHVVEEVSITMAPSDIPKPKIKYTFEKEKARK
jgi:hypothetical protein